MSYTLGELLTDAGLDKAGITKNELTQITGLSHTYISSLRKGIIKRPGRDKIISIATGLNLSLEETNALLRQYEFKSIIEHDADIFIGAAKRRAIKGIQPLYDNLSLDLILISLQSLEGDEMVVCDKPAGVLIRPAHLTLHDHMRNITDPVYNKLREAFLEERKRLFDESLQHHTIHELICRHCLEDYLSRAEKSDEEREHIGYHVEQLLICLRNPNYHLSMLDSCPNLKFHIKRRPSGGGDTKDKVLFIGKGDIDHVAMEESQRCSANRLYGFATDSPKLVGHFRSEFDELSKCVVDKYSHQDAMTEHVLELAQRHGIRIKQ